MKYFAQILVFTSLLLVTFAFNISPVPNYVFSPPKLDSFFPKYSSSLFGFTINLRKNGILIGAPKAQTHLAEQSNINETGSIFRCMFDNNFNGKPCEPYMFDRSGNLYENSLNSRLKDNQLLGFAMDGGTSDTDKLVACAPQFKSNMSMSEKGVWTEYYYLHGICYWTSDTKNSWISVVNPITSLKDPKMQVTNENGKLIYNYMIGEMGFNVHISDDANEVIIGAPGVYNWKGSVVRYRQDDSSIVQGGEGEVAPPTGFDYLNEVLSSHLLDVEEDSYLGYAVTSGKYYGPTSNELLYAASAPQAFDQTGEVYIFSYLKTFKGEFKMNILKKFTSEQMGEYFGYTLLTEDFNNDGYPDLAISAPLHSKDTFNENGAVYIYINKGGLQFQQQTILKSDYELSGRFGTALGRIGDINMDQYNDLAVGAPFEDDGAVYIYHGTWYGIKTGKPSQKLVPSKNHVTTPTFMFGHSISKGVDIDENEYRDIAVGAPEGEKVFVFRTYPVGHVIVELTPSKREISQGDKSIKITGCWRINSQTPLRNEQDFQINLKADQSNYRAKWMDTNRFNYDKNVTIGSQNKCYEFELKIDYNPGLIFKPLDIEMNYAVHDQATDTSKFCTTCVKIDNTEDNYVKTSITYITGCASTVCFADLTVQSKLLNVNLPYILGSSKTMQIQYDVENLGEPAYLPQINITLDNYATFAKTPSTCKLSLNHQELLCDLTKGNPIKKGEKNSLTVSIDMTKVAGTELVVRADVFSSGQEKNAADNKIINKIGLSEFSHVEIHGKSTKEEFSLEIVKENQNITHKFEVVNHGPSTLKEITITVCVPTVYFNANNKNGIKIIDETHLTIEGQYEGQKIIWSQFSDAIPKFVARKRNRRSTSSEKIVKVIHDDLPPNRTISFSCSDQFLQEYRCLNTEAFIKNFVPGSNPITMMVNFTMNIDVFEEVFDEVKDIFLLETIAKVEKTDATNIQAIKVDSRFPYTLVFKHLEASTPIWVYIISILIGILLLVIVSYVLYRMGFFKRKTKEQLEKERLHSESEGQPLQTMNNQSSDNEQEPVQKTE